MGIMEKMRLDGKRSFVTGGARGIGKAIATALAEAGSDVALLDVDIATARQTAAEIAQATGRVIRAYEVDVTQEAQVDAVVQQLIEDLGGLDCAFCNAGICLNVPAAEMTLAQWRKVIDINLTGVFLTARAAGRYMIGQGKGSIVNTASMSAHIVNVPQPQCSYNASKAGVIQLTKSLAIEWAPYGVRTLAKYEKMYCVAATNNPSCWLGPVWGVSNYMVFRGLKRYGYEELAAELAEKTLAMLAADIRACGEMHEYYDGNTGAPVVNPGFQNWNLLAVNMGAWLRGERAVAEI